MKAVDAAVNWSARTGAPVFPCREDKRPATPNGFKDAVAHPVAILDLWRRYPGSLIGMPTGAFSGVAVLDLDFTRHPESLAWFEANKPRLPKTMAIETRSGGLHLYYENRPGLKCTTNLFAPGVDIRADGGYVIAWAAHGYPTVSDAPLAPWPSWVAPPRPKRSEQPPAPPRVPDDVAIGRLIRWAVGAPEGERNTRLHWIGRRLAEYVATGMIGRNEAIALTEQTGIAAGLPQIEARRTAESALRAAS